jgi:hypothetical protein
MASESGIEDRASSKLPEDVYLEERKLLIDEEREAARTFDKAMLTLSGGALGLSLSFIKQLVPHPHLIGLLATAWSSLAVALLATILGLHISQSAIRRARDMLDGDQRGDKDALNQKNTPARWTDCFNWIAATTFMVGIVLLVMFALLNLKSNEPGGY